MSGARKAFCSPVDNGWVVHECPYCHETHSHGGGGLSHREPHCDWIEPSGSYELTPVSSEHDARLMQAEQQGFLVRRSRRPDEALHEAWNRRGLPNVIVTKKTRNAIARWDFLELPPDRHPSSEAVRDFVARVVSMGVDRRRVLYSPRLTSVEASWPLALRIAEMMLRVVGVGRTGR